MLEHQVRQLVAESQIRQAMCRYARGVDRLDSDLIRSAFHSDGWDDHGPFNGDVDGLIHWVTSRHAHIPQSVHFLGNCSIEFADERVALVESYYIALLRLSGDATETHAFLHGQIPDGDVELTVTGRYIDRFEERSQQWRIARRRNTFDNIRIVPATSGSGSGVEYWGTRNRADAIYAMRRDVLST